jgi:ligand-binding sensor domain-containing protein
MCIPGTIAVMTIFKRILNYSLSLVVLFNCCNAQNIAPDIAVFPANTATEIDNNIRSIFHDNKGNYWFGTNDAGVYRYDGKNLIQFTVNDGLSNNQVQSIREDKSGHIWFATGILGVSRFNGQTFTTYTTKENDDFEKEWKIRSDDLWFYAGGGVYRYSGDSLAYLPLPKTDLDFDALQNSPNRLSDRLRELWHAFIQ